MPIYEYQCGACGEDSEFLQKVNEGAKRKCPECGALRLKRKISAVGFRLKGGGWYETDFKASDKKRNLHDGDGKPADKKDEKKKDDKSTSDAKKPDTKSKPEKAKKAASSGD